MTIDIDFNGLSGVDGSARFSFDTTTAVASVSGPITSRLAAEHPVRATIDVHVRPLSSVSSTTEKHTGIILKGILERACILSQHPRTSIQVVVQALSPYLRAAYGQHASHNTDADLRLAAEINACSLALLNAGSVPMRGVVCAVAVAQATSASEPLIAEPGSPGTTACSGCFAFIFGVDNNLFTGESGTCGIPQSKMIWTNYRACPGNAFSIEALQRAEDVALEGAAAVRTKMKESLSVSFAGNG
ncbi:exosome component Rrp46 [Chiua virens]|nr:exosome component Rrp46 [Chiua virens]